MSRIIIFASVSSETIKEAVKMHVGKKLPPFLDGGGDMFEKKSELVNLRL